ncbi:helix-turn-helix domain-containing protein [Mesorhizobium japonicum]|uniref:helix-turn-helix domain-containing protein n=1 Tax=Mesorhizobium japonicum TaxID=2066070 RepID=UPI003B59EA03
MDEMDQEKEMQAREILLRVFANSADIAWAWEILLNQKYVNDEERYKRIHDKIKFINSLKLPTRYKDGSPSGERKGVLVAGVDIRESQYLNVEDVVTGIKNAKFNTSFVDSLNKNSKRIGRPKTLSPEETEEIKKLHIKEPNLTAEEIGKRYQVSDSLVRKYWN